MAQPHPFLTIPFQTNDHAIGRDDAPVTLVEYGDYESPLCQSAEPVLKELRKRFGSRIRTVFRHFPLTRIHRHAWMAACAAEAAARQNFFWEMHDVLFANQDALEFENILDYAAAVGVDFQEFEPALASNLVRQRIEQDLMSGEASGVDRAPAFFINGVRYDGATDVESLGTALQRAIAASESELKRKVG